ncbi:MAG TPA: sugar phosphate nucleotidyltransferase [Gammaproteobacteria bacterium]
MPVVIPVILSGGSGTRLWPLSRQERPKQFLPLVGERTMLQETYLRTTELRDLVRPPIIVCNESHRFLVGEQMREVGAAARIILEPEGRNTAPAIAVAAWLTIRSDEDVASGADAEAASASSGSSSVEAADPLLLVLPADHFIEDTQAFLQAVRVGVDAASKGYLVTFGIVPSRPETGYGYIRKGARGEEAAAWYRLDQFVEKPDLPTAEHYVKSGEYLWNSGMFLFSARRYLEELRSHAPDIASACERAADEAVVDGDFTRLGRAFLASPSDSIDYAVMEKTRSAAVVPLDAGWSDVGSWPALHDILEKDADGNVLRGDVIVEGCRNCYVSAADRLVALVGLDGCVVVETADAVLVMRHEAAQDVKRVVDALKKTGSSRV